MHHFNATLSNIENRLTELETMAQLGRIVTEAVDCHDFAAQQSTLCTLFYIMLDMISDAQKSQSRLFVTSGPTL